MAARGNELELIEGWSALRTSTIFCPSIASLRSAIRWSSMAVLGEQTNGRLEVPKEPEAGGGEEDLHRE